MRITLLLACYGLAWSTGAMRADYLAQLRRETVDMFYHGYSNYMKHAFPEDELRPITCAPLTRDRYNPGHVSLNDALGNYSLTLIDSLSTLAILAGGPQDGSYTGRQALSDFQDGVAEFVRYYGDGRPGPSGAGIRARGFDLDSKVQVFETVIRGVGGLLSAHLFAIGELPMTGYDPKPVAPSRDDPLELTPPVAWPNGLRYDGQLLRLALDLSERLLPAFYTPTGIPYPRVNLRSGIPFYVNSPLHQSFDTVVEEPPGGPEVTETCSAGAGSLTLEFTVLSRLTGDGRFEQAAKRAFWEVWHRRSEIGLIGNGIDAERGLWNSPHAGIGAGMDSFFEYALKSHILLSGHEMPNTTSSSSSSSRRPNRTGWLDPNSLHAPLPWEMHSSDAFLKAWHQAHASVKRYLYTDRSHYPYYLNGHRATGQPYTMWIDSLGAFYPGLLALAGEVEEAIEANLVYTALWTRYSALPERWSVREGNVEAGIAWWPGRPEFIESTYHIYRATGDPWYLHVGEMVLRDIHRRCHAPCGWAGLQDVQTGEKQDRMESFFLGETAKYMYLLFDPDHPLNKLDAAYVFTTEGHPLVIPKSRSRKPAKSRYGSDHYDHNGKTRGARERPMHAYYDESFTNSCPAPPRDTAALSLTGSATAARPDLFSVSRFTDLYRTPNMRSAVETKDRRAKTHKAVSNHTLFPWTLPPTMLPDRGTCAAPPERFVTWIEFPAGDASTTSGSSSGSGSLGSRFGASVVWHDHQGPTVKALAGLRLQLERERDDSGEHVWRISHVGNTQLGPHETVFFYAEHVSQLKDEAFTCRRRRDVVEINVIVDTRAPTILDSNSSLAGTHPSPSPSLPTSDSDSLLQSLLRAVSLYSSPSPSSTSTSSPASAIKTYALTALTAVGIGSFPVPSVPDTPIGAPAGQFPWTSVFLAGHACDAPLSSSVPREHQVIVMRRGGCSFSAKLANIPSFSPSPQSLQLVIVVDEDGDDGGGGKEGKEGDEEEPLPRPLLDSEQFTPKGIKRPHGIPLVLLRGQAGTYQRFKEAMAVGMRRKYRVESQGLAIANAVVI